MGRSDYTTRCSTGRSPARQRASTWTGPLIFGIDETLERRRGAKIRARASDPVRSSRSQVVKASGSLDLPGGWATCPGPDAMGLAGAHGADPLLPTAGTPAQEAHRLGPPDGHATVVLVGDNSYAVLPLLPVPLNPLP